MSTALDQTKKDEFAGQMLSMLNHAFTSVLVSVGYRAGLYETMAGLPPSNSHQIAEAAGLNERYVREWLGAMVTARIIEYDPRKGNYFLPPEHAASLTRAAGPDNIATFMQYIALVGNIEDEILECFYKGGGVHPSRYPRFQQLQAEETSRIFDASLVDDILPLVPGLTARLEAGIDVIDIGCGSGHAINLMAKAYPKSRFAGIDLTENGIAAAKTEAQQLGLANAHFEVKDAATPDLMRQYDLITAFDSIHDQAQPTRVLRNIVQALRPGGVFLMQDIAASSKLEENLEHPLGPMLYSASVLYCMTVSLAFNGEGLGTMWGEQKAREKLAEAGFNQVEVRQIPSDILNSYYIARRV